jgi:hypothetical protein
MERKPPINQRETNQTIVSSSFHHTKSIESSKVFKSGITQFFDIFTYVSSLLWVEPEKSPPTEVHGQTFNLRTDADYLLMQANALAL